MDVNGEMSLEELDFFETGHSPRNLFKCEPHDVMMFTPDVEGHPGVHLPAPGNHERVRGSGVVHGGQGLVVFPILA